MGPNMKDGGSKIKLAEKVGLYTLMVMFMLVTGKKIKLMDMEFIVILMVQGMKDFGKKIDRMVKEQKPGQMVLNTWENMSWERSMEKEHLIGQTVLLILVNLLTITLRVKVFTNGLILGGMMGIGKTIKWTEEEFLLGQMEGNMKENTLMIKSQALAFLFGLMVVVMREVG